jgi:hypothetical protein
MTKVNVMADLETWGKKPGFDLRSIGGCVFAPFTRHNGPLIHDGSLGTIRPFYVATDNPSSDPDVAPPVPNETGNAWQWDGVDAYRKYPLRRDPETVQWWSEQSDEAQAAFASPVDLRVALIQFADWLRALVGDTYDPNDHARRVPDDIKLWSHGPAFDPPILAAAYDACGLPLPWHYRAPRDTRTVFDLAGQDDHSAFMQQFNHGTAHNALDDAISQAQCVCAAIGMITRTPIPMILHCPTCHQQHIDEATEAWPNPPHRSHECQKCGAIWRPADIATAGVQYIDTVGKADSYDNRAPVNGLGDPI